MNMNTLQKHTESTATTNDTKSKQKLQCVYTAIDLREIYRDDQQQKITMNENHRGHETTDATRPSQNPTPPHPKPIQAERTPNVLHGVRHCWCVAGSPITDH